jgi:hypothetical protein
MPSPSRRLLRRLLLASGASCLVACGGRADLAELSLQAVPDDGETLGGSGGQAGAGGAFQAGAGGVAGAGAGGAGQGGAAGGAVCDASQKIPREADGSFTCESKNGSTFFFCELRCYAPGPSTLPGACRSPADPELNKLPDFQFQSCGFQGPTTGPFCDEEAEKIAGNTPACCYLGPSEPCVGRPLLVLGRLHIAALRAVAWG